MVTPRGWVDAQVGDVAVFERGIAFPSSDKRHEPGTGLIACLRTANVQEDVTWDDLWFIPESHVRSSSKLLQPGDILMSTANSQNLVGKVARVAEMPTTATLGAFISVIRSRPEISPEFLFYKLRTAQVQTALRASASQTTNIANVSAKQVLALPIDIPPANEQRRIVAKLDAIFEQTRAAKACLERLPALLDRLKRSILAAAFRGELTADWREAHPDVEPASVLLHRVRAGHRQRWEEAVRAKGKTPSPTTYRPPTAIEAEPLGALPPGWAWASVDDLSELQLGQQRAPIHANAEKTHPYVRAANIKWDGLDLSDVKEMGFPDPERYQLRFGDVLLSEASGSPNEVGKPAIWRDEIPGCCYQKTLLRARPRSPEVLSEWLHAAFLADALLGRFARMAPGVGILHLTAERMLGWPVPIAPVEEQALIVERLRAAINAVSMLEKTVANVRQNAERVEQAALARAFRGELVGHDPSDEPASALLERLRATSAVDGGSRDPTSGRVKAPSGIRTALAATGRGQRQATATRRGRRRPAYATERSEG